MNRLISFRFQVAQTWLLLLAAGFVLAGCASSTPIHYYQLAALSQIPAPEAAGPAVKKTPPLLGIGPVHLPEYLERPQIVTRLTPNSLQFNANHRWAEPLADNITWVIRENLARLLHSFRMTPYPWPLSTPIEHQLTIDILHFESSGRSARLEAEWNLRNGSGEILLPTRRSTFEVPAAAANHLAIAAALSESLALFCREVAEELRALSN